MIQALKSVMVGIFSQQNIILIFPGKWKKKINPFIHVYLANEDAFKLLLIGKY